MRFINGVGRERVMRYSFIGHQGRKGINMSIRGQTQM